MSCFFVVVVVVGSAHQECNLNLKLDMKNEDSSGFPQFERI